MKTCSSGKRCKTKAGGLISKSNFETNNKTSGGLRHQCRKCRVEKNATPSNCDSFSAMQHFMTRTKWGKAESVAINDYASQIRMPV